MRGLAGRPAGRAHAAAGVADAAAVRAAVACADRRAVVVRFPGLRRGPAPAGAGRSGRFRFGVADPGPALPGGLRPGVDRRHGPVRDGPTGPGQGCGAGARRLALATGRSGRHGALRRARCPAPRGHPGTAEADGDVGQRPAGLRRPRSADPARLPQDRDPEQRRRAAHPAGRRVRGRRVASGAGRDRGHRVPYSGWLRVGGARGRSAGAGAVAGGSRTGSLWSLPPLVGQTAPAPNFPAPRPGCFPVRARVLD